MSCTSAQVSSLREDLSRNLQEALGLRVSFLGPYLYCSVDIYSEIRFIVLLGFNPSGVALPFELAGLARWLIEA